MMMMMMIDDDDDEDDENLRELCRANERHLDSSALGGEFPDPNDAKSHQSSPNHALFGLLFGPQKCNFLSILAVFFSTLADKNFCRK